MSKVPLTSGDLSELCFQGFKVPVSGLQCVPCTIPYRRTCGFPEGVATCPTGAHSSLSLSLSCSTTLRHAKPFLFVFRLTKNGQRRSWTTVIATTRVDVTKQLYYLRVRTPPCPSTSVRCWQPQQATPIKEGRPTSHRSARWMSGLESFRDSRSAEASAPLPLATAAEAAAAVRQQAGDYCCGADAAAAAAGVPQDERPASSRGGGQDVVFPLVLALYAQQQRCRRQRQEMETLSKTGAPTTGGGSAAAGVGGSGTAGSSGLVVVDIVGGGEEDDDGGRDDWGDDGGFSARGVAAAAADGAAAVCGDWEGEAKALVRELREARRAFPSEVSISFFSPLCRVTALCKRISL